MCVQAFLLLRVGCKQVEAEDAGVRGVVHSWQKMGTQEIRNTFSPPNMRSEAMVEIVFLSQPSPANWCTRLLLRISPP